MNKILAVLTALSQSTLHYKYSDMSLVPDSQFNANAANAREHKQIQISSGSTYTMTEQINSDLAPTTLE